MSATLTQAAFDLSEAVRNLVTEDDEPVDSIFSEKQQRLLAEALYAGWTPPPDPDADETAAGKPRPFWASANVGIFRSVRQPAIVPDVFVSLDVTPPPDLHTLETRSYFMWETGKAPDVVVEIVSNREGNELGSNFKDYARMGVTYYVVFDPGGELSKEMGGEMLWVHELLFGRTYRRRDDYRLPEIGLSLTLWNGRFENSDDLWLRWCDEKGALIPTPNERADQAEARADQAEARAEQLAAKLRELGVSI